MGGRVPQGAAGSAPTTAGYLENRTDERRSTVRMAGRGCRHDAAGQRSAAPCRVVGPGPHQRTRAGLNHLAFHAGDRASVDALAAAAPEHGWVPLFADRYPHAGGPEHYAAYLEDQDGYEVELIAG